MGEAQGILRLVGTQLFGLAQDIVSEGMTLEDDILEFVVDEFSR